METVRVRPAAVGDAAAVAVYHGRCVRRTFAERLAAGSFRVPDPDDVATQLRSWFAPGSGFESRVADRGGTPIGHVTVAGPLLVHLFVAPECQHAGLGRRLLGIGEALIAEGGHAEMELHARVENTAAIDFYERAGWRSTDRLIRTSEHGFEYDERVLVKSTSAVSDRCRAGWLTR